MRQYRSMRRVHHLAKGHKVDNPNPKWRTLLDTHTTFYAYRTALCGQTAYCKQMPDGAYYDQFGAVPFTDDGPSTTCMNCIKGLRL